MFGIASLQIFSCIIWIGEILGYSRKITHEIDERHVIHYTVIFLSSLRRFLRLNTILQYTALQFIDLTVYLHVALSVEGGGVKMMSFRSRPNVTPLT